jgi:hypothetical protein
LVLALLVCLGVKQVSVALMNEICALRLLVVFPLGDYYWYLVLPLQFLAVFLPLAIPRLGDLVLLAALVVRQILAGLELEALWQLGFLRD